MKITGLRFKTIGICIILCTLLCGCTKAEEVPFINVDGQENIISYTLVSVGYEDVVLTQKIDCVYVQTSEQEVTFDVTGKYVDKVYVKSGDKVSKGDVLCELSSKSLEESIEDLEYRISRNELLLSFLDKDEELDIQNVWLNNPGNAEESIEKIHSQYELTRQSYNDSLEFDRLELEQKKTELRNSRIYASIDGVVYKIKDNLEGSTTRKGEVIITIVDNKECLFAVKNTEYKDLFSEGVIVPMRIPYSSAAGEYELMPKDIASWDDKLLFTVFTGPDNTEIEVGTSGSITATIDSREKVLALPKTVVHQADGKSYVYIVNENNVREVKWIETGLFGDTNVEIISGLEEGEKVVKK